MMPLYSETREWMIDKSSYSNIGLCLAVKTSNGYRAVDRRYNWYYDIYVRILIYNLISKKR